MRLFDFFKRKKIKKPSFAKATEGKEKPEVRPRAPRVSGVAYRVLVEPHVTEKATNLGEKNKYVFKVLPEANKIEIKKGVESLYNVDVTGVRIINIHRKKRRVGRRREGWKKGYKKAIVEIKKGQKIEIMPR